MIAAASAVLIAGNVPETKGKTLEEIEAVFSSAASSLWGGESSESERVVFFSPFSCIYFSSAFSSPSIFN